MNCPQRPATLEIRGTSSLKYEIASTGEPHPLDKSINATQHMHIQILNHVSPLPPPPQVHRKNLPITAPAILPANPPVPPLKAPTAAPVAHFRF